MKVDRYSMQVITQIFRLRYGNKFFCDHVLCKEKLARLATYHFIEIIVLFGSKNLLD